MKRAASLCPAKAEEAAPIVSAHCSGERNLILGHPAGTWQVQKNYLQSRAHRARL